jgi:hypothetical protein
LCALSELGNFRSSSRFNAFRVLGEAGLIIQAGKITNIQKNQNSHSKKIKLSYPILKLIKLNLLIVFFILKKQNQNNINFKKT